MNENTVTRRKMSSLQIMGAMMVLSLGAGFASGLARARLGSEVGDMIVVGGGVIVLLVGCITMIPYWRRLDEAAREAHKDAWMWGGVVGYTLAAIYAALLLLVPGLPMVDLLGLEPREAMAGGIILTIFAQALCYAIAWGIWWMRRR